jgi:pimeloyl-ACP methyl ester carboxylesterase
MRAVPGAVLVVLALVAAACTLPNGSVPGRSIAERSTDDPTGATSPLRWTDCDDDLAGLQCATLTVPRDRARPDGPTIELALARHRAGSSRDRIGSIVVNPGGPGASGIDLVPQLASAMDERVLDRFDLVGFDPRGVGRSSPVTCIEDKATLNALDGDPDTLAEISRTVEVQRAVTKACVEAFGPLLPHLSTTATAHDLDAIRAALGEERLTYLGFSYGTEIGAVYATLYPDRVRALVLDGAVAPDLEAGDLALTQAKGFERAFASFVDRCRTDARCAAAPDARGLHEQVRTAAERAPIPVAGTSGRSLAIGDLQYGVVSGLYDQALWAYLAKGLRDAARGDGSWLLALADLYHERRADGTYPNSDDANLAISCADDAARPTPADAEVAAARYAREAPLVGAQLGWSTMACHGWPFGAVQRPAIATTTSAPILVIGTVDDPATPYEWSQRLAAALAPAAQLLTWDGEGHTAYLKSDCVTAAVDTLLLELRLPAAGTRCAAGTDARDDAFAGIAPDLREAFMTNSGLDRPVADCVATAVADALRPDDLAGLYQGELSESLERTVALATTRCAGRR